jgi:hypothetical protein
MNVNETIKAPQDFNADKDKLKHASVSVFFGFEFDPNIISIHVLGGDEFDHVFKNYLQDAEGWVEVTIANA